MPPRCTKCLATLMPDATVCLNCGRPVPPKSVLTQEREMDETQFVRLAPGELLPEDEPVRRTAASRRWLILAVVLGLLVGASLLLVLASLFHARH